MCIVRRDLKEKCFLIDISDLCVLSYLYCLVKCGMIKLFYR